jgi:antibiotic biosynthesis monooxygenase (ABM) superfamily enzyme
MSEHSKRVAAPASGQGVTIVTQTRVHPGQEEAFALWQKGTSQAVARFPGFLEQTVMPPSPPTQLDWVILQRFDGPDLATAWLNSKERLERLAGAQPMLIGLDDVHLVRDGASGVLPAPVSAVISTRIKPGCEAAFRAWEQRIAAAQSRAPGFQGYRFEPPIPRVQDDWLAILRFDSEANLQRWLDSPERHTLLEDSKAFTEEFHTRIARTGFEQWFPVSVTGAPSPAAWKQNMLVLLMLYPIVFLFGFFVQTPILSKRAGLSFPVALFVGNAVSVFLLSYLLPRMSGGFAWWLQPVTPDKHSTDIAGAILLVALYIVMVIAFSRLF